MIDHLKTNWRTSLVGFAQLVNGLVPAWEAYRTAMSGLLSPAEVQHLAMHSAIFLLINGVLQQVKGLVSKDAGKGSDRPQEVVDEKLSNVPPIDDIRQ